MSQINRELQINLQRAMPVGELLFSKYLHWLFAQHGGQILTRGLNAGPMYVLEHYNEELVLRFPLYNGQITIVPVSKERTSIDQVEGMPQFRYWRISHAEWGSL